MRFDLATILIGMGHVLDRDFVAFQDSPVSADFTWLAQSPKPTEAEIDAAAPAILAALAAAQADDTLYEAERADLQSQLQTAATRLAAIRDAPSMTQGQAVDAIQDTAAIVLRMLKYIRKL